MKCNQEVNLLCSYFQYKKSTGSATNISSGWINSRCTCYFCCLQHKKSTIVKPNTESNRHPAELTSPCAAAAAVTLQDVSGRSELCEIPWCLSRWLERLVVLPCFFTWLLHIPSPSPLPSTMLLFCCSKIRAVTPSVTDWQTESSNVYHVFIVKCAGKNTHP